MPKCTLTEDEIVQGLRSDDGLVKTRTESSIFKDDEVNASLKGYVQNKGGTWHQAQVVFAYAFETFTAKVRIGKYPSTEIQENDWRKTMSGIGYFAWDKKNYGQRSNQGGGETLLGEEALQNISIDPFEEKDVEDFQNFKCSQLMSHFSTCGRFPAGQCKFIMESYHIHDLIDEKIAESIELDRLSKLTDNKTAKSPKLDRSTISKRRTTCKQCISKRFNL